MVRLVLFQNDQRLGLELKDGVYRLGREKPADVVVPDGTISANHAELQVEGTSCRLRDLGSRNGTFVNGQQIRVSTVVKPGDEILLGSVKMTVEFPEEVRAPQPKLSPGVQPKVQIQAARNAAAKLPWSLRAWIAGAEAILFLLMLFFLTLLYSDSVAAAGRMRTHYQGLASQYWQVLRTTQDGDIPPPIHDTSLRDPVMIANAEGKILYPKSVTLPDGTVQPIKSPLINPKTNRVFNDLKNGTYDLTVSGVGKEGAVSVKSYPIYAGGNLLGFVVARPGEDEESPLPFILTLLFISAAISLLVLYFAMRPVVSAVQSQIAAIRTRVSPLLR